MFERKQKGRKKKEEKNIKMKLIEKKKFMIIQDTPNLQSVMKQFCSPAKARRRKIARIFCFLNI